MPFTLVGSTTFTIPASDADEDITLPGTPLEDDVIIYAHASDHPITPGVTTSGYTDLATSHSLQRPGYESGYKVMGGTPDTVINFDNSGNDEDTAGVIQVWRGVDTSTPIDATAVTDTGSVGMPRGDQYTTANDGALIIIIGFLDDDNVASTVTAPSGYGDLLAQDNSSGSDNATVMIASKVKATAGLEIPDAFGGSGSDDWVSVIFALRQASAAAGDDGIGPAGSSATATDATVALALVTTATVVES